MSEIKVNFIYKDQKTEMNFSKNSLIKDILGSFALKIEKSIEDFNFLYSGEKISINDISTNPSSKNNYKKKLFDQAIPIDVKRIKEEKDILKISEDSSVVPKENSNEDI